VFPAYQSVEKAIPGFFNYRLAKDASANLTIFLALKDEAKFGTTSCAAPARFSTGCSASFRPPAGQILVEKQKGEH